MSKPDTSTHTMLDDVTLSIIEEHDASAYAVAGYINGHYANWDALVGKYGNSGKFLLSISVENADTAQAGDFEPGCMSNSEVVSWVKKTAAAGKKANDLRYYPKVYTSISNAAALISSLTAAGVKRSEYMLWSAHYTKVAHICGPAAKCGYTTQADATQYTDTYAGASLDGSLCYGYFFAGPPKAASVPAPDPAPASAAKGPFRQVATSNGKSLDSVALARKTSALFLASTTLNAGTAAEKTAFLSYLVNTGAALKMPAGLVFYTSNSGGTV